MARVGMAGTDNVGIQRFLRLAQLLAHNTCIYLFVTYLIQKVKLPRLSQGTNAEELLSEFACDRWTKHNLNT